ncbi:hypothetical protein BDF14DRAFT_1291753 [Spinellus fusiger]|nr:hypothetical protein BDF14DRAFT_1291753 [Spinellus fusiger]
MSYSVPDEILEITAQHLSTADKAQCSLVNKAWSKSFAHSLYTNVLIRRRKQLELFYRTLLQTTSQGQGFGRLVRYLTMEYPVGLTNKEFNYIVEYCPHLLSIDFNPKLWRYLSSPSRLNTLKYIERLPVLNDERHAITLIKEHGHRLTQLRLEGAMINDWIRDHQLGSILSFAPNLRQLDLTGAYPTDTHPEYNHPEFTLDDMELIHSTCPHLEHFKVSIMQLEPTDLTKNRVISPANNMRVLHLHDAFFDHWKDIHYFIRKYPHLEEFSNSGLFSMGFHDMSTEFELENNDNIYMAMAQQWPRLRSFTDHGISLNLWPGRHFFEALQSSGASLTTLRLTFHNITRHPFDDHSHFKAMLDSSRDTLETLELKVWNDCNMSNLFCSLGQYQRLTSLTISGNKEAVFTLDFILDSCPLLKKMSFCNGELILSDKYHKSSLQIHSYLSELFIYNLILDIHAITNHLSIRCPKLSSLTILSLYNKQVFPNFSVEINMPNHTFDKLRISNILFVCPYSNNERELIHPIQLVSLSLLKRMNSTLRRNGSSEIDWHHQEDHEKSVEQSMARWYHVYKKEEEEMGRLYRLPPNEAVEASNYTIPLEAWNQRSEREVSLHKEQWKESIYRGLISIRCQDIAHFSFERITL